MQERSLTRFPFHELDHFSVTWHYPGLRYFARTSRSPGAEIAHFLYEQRACFQELGWKAIIDPRYAMASVRGAQRAGLVYRDIGLLVGLGILEGASYYCSRE